MKLPPRWNIAEEVARRGLPEYPMRKMGYEKHADIFDLIVNRWDEHVWPAVPEGHSLNTITIGGGYGGGKTFTMLSIAVALALKYPRSKWCFARKTLVLCTETVIVDFKTYFGHTYQSFNAASQVATFHNGSVIDFRGENIDKDPNLERWRGYNPNGIFIEQAEEVTRQFYEQCLARTGRNLSAPTAPAFVMLSVNPAESWVKTDLFRPYKNGNEPLTQRYFSLLISDNPRLYGNPAYMAKFDQMSEGFRKTMLYGDWDALDTDEPFQVFPTEWIDAAMQRHRECPPEGHIYAVGADIATAGDSGAIGMVYATGFDFRAWPGRETPTPGAFVMRMQHELPGLSPDTPIGVDALGEGHGAADKIAETWKSTIQIKVSNKTAAMTNMGAAKFQFANKRAEIIWRFREAIHPDAETKMSIPDDPVVRSGLRSFRFSVTGNTISIEAKDDIRKRIGRSPDQEEAMMYALYAHLRGTSVFGGWLK